MYSRLAKVRNWNIKKDQTPRKVDLSWAGQLNQKIQDIGGQPRGHDGKVRALAHCPGTMVPWPARLSQLFPFSISEDLHQSAFQDHLPSTQFNENTLFNEHWLGMPIPTGVSPNASAFAASSWLPAVKTVPKTGRYPSLSEKNWRLKSL